MENSESTLPKNWGPKTIHLVVYRRFRDLMANIFWTKHDIDNRKDVRNYNWSPARLETSWTLAHKRHKIGPAFFAPSVYSAFYFIARLRTRKSTNGIEPNFATLWKVNHVCKLHVNNLRGFLQKFGGAKTAYFVAVLISTKQDRSFCLPSVNARNDYDVVLADDTFSQTNHIGFSFQ